MRRRSQTRFLPFAPLHFVWRSALLCTGLIIAPHVQAADLNGPHTHGEMEILPLWDAEQHTLTLEIVAPAQDLVGYERDPDSAREKKALRDFEETVDPLSRITTNPESACLFSSGRSSSALFSAMPHKHGLLDKTHAHPAGINGHVDFKLVYRYECETRPRLRFDYFSVFPSLKKINVRAKEIDGEIIQTLTADQPELDLTL